jgi:hypothetical protein
MATVQKRDLVRPADHTDPATQFVIPPDSGEAKSASSSANRDAKAYWCGIHPEDSLTRLHEI